MKRISISTKVVDKFGAGKHGYTDGNAATGVPPTDLEAELFDQIQEELCAIVEEDGGALAPPVAVDGSGRNQVITKLKALFARKLQATEAVDGIAKVATQAQTDAGADDASIVTPKKARNGYGSLFAGIGRFTLPSFLGGFTFQWGAAAPAVGGVVITFPMAFPNSVFGVWTSSASGGSLAKLGVDTIGLASFKFYVDVAGSNHYWLAIGR